MKYALWVTFNDFTLKDYIEFFFDSKELAEKFRNEIIDSMERMGVDDRKELEERYYITEWPPHLPQHRLNLEEFLAYTNKKM